MGDDWAQATEEQEARELASQVAIAGLLIIVEKYFYFTQVL